MSYRRFFLIRLAQALFALWLVATLVLVMFFIVLPSQPATSPGDNKRPPPRSSG